MPAPKGNVTKPGYMSIMVTVDLSPTAADRVRLACRLADQFSSHLIGIAAHESFVPLYFEAGVALPPSITEVEEKRATEEMAAAETLFRDGIGMRNGVEWRQAIARPSAFICAQARAADLVIVGRQGPQDVIPGSLVAHPGDLVMQCGRPILIVPPTSHGGSIERVLVAWKDTREARRAVWDSLAFLARAEEVLVVSVGDEPQKASVVDVVAHLACHGIGAESLLRIGQDSGSAAGELLELAEDWEADLVVCGAYGHGRLREWIFGGVTREMLNRSPVPCLMSH